MSITLSPIGTTKIDDSGFSIIISDKFKNGLKGLEGFSHLSIYWYADKAKYEDSMLTIPKPYKNAPESLGVFATHSQFRPNGICHSIAQVINIDVNSGIINLAWIDTLDDTPIIDIKPYLPCIERVENISVPEWCKHWPKNYEESANFDWENEFLFKE